MTHRWLPLLTIALAGSAQAAGTLPGFGWFAGMAGSCWVGTFPDGKTEHRQCYTTQFGRFLRGTAALRVRQEGELQLVFEGDSVFAWDESRRKIVYYIWGADGSHRQLEAEYLGDELAFPVPDKSDATKVAYRSVWRRIDSDTFEVRRERPSGDGWGAELKVVYRRTGLDTPKSR
jgi:hypothetical protein